MKNPLISVVTPCLNSERTIERTLSSIYNQTFNDYEYIVVDGASSDGTLDILDKYVKLFNGKMRYISEPDSGLYNAFNKCIKLANGEFIWIVNSDDYVQKDALKIFSNEIIKTDSKILCGRMNIIHSNGNVETTELYSMADYHKAKTLMMMGTPHPATIVHRSIYKIYGGFDERFYISADLDWFQRIARNNVSVHYFNKIVTNFVQGGISTAKGNVEKKKHDRKLLFKKHAKNKSQYYWWFIQDWLRKIRDKYIPNIHIGIK